MDGLCGISRSLYGQPWTSWCTATEVESEEETTERGQSHPAADVMRLPKEDMTLFGFCPEQDDFYVVICELCGLGIKPMGMNHHMNLRHSKGEETIKTSSTHKTLNKEFDAKPKNRKHISSTGILSDFGHGVGPPHKVLSSEAASISVGNSEHHQEACRIRSTSSSKVLKLEADKINKLSSSSKNHLKQYSSQDSNVLLNNTLTTKLPSVKSSRSSKGIHVDIMKPSKTLHAHKAVPIKSGFRLQLVGTSNCIVFKRNSRSVLTATSELKVRHRRRHKRNRLSHKSKLKNKSSRRFLPVILKSSISSSPVVAPSPSLAPSPYVALTPLKAVKWNNNVEGVPAHLKPSSSAHASGGSGFRSGSIVPTTKASDGVMQVLTVDTSSSHGLKPELRVPLLSCKPLTSLRNHLEVRMGQSHSQGNSILVPTVMPHASLRVPDIAWSAMHPKPLGVCPLQIRKVGGLISTDRRLDRVWQYMKSALLEQEAYQTTVLCSAPSSQPDFHLNHKSSIKTILASLSANNYARNSVCKPTNIGLRQLPLGINNEKPYSTSRRGVMDVSSSVMLISSHHSKTISNPNTFLSHVTKSTPSVRLNPMYTTTQPYPGIFLRNGHHILPRHFRICLKRRKPVPVISSFVKKPKEEAVNEPVENRISQNEYSFPKSIPILQFPIPNGLSEQVNNYMPCPEEGYKQVVPRSEIELDVVNSIGMLTTNGESLCETTGRLSGLDQLKSDLISGLHSLKNGSRIMDANSKSPCRKVSPTSLSNVRMSSTPGTVQVSTPQIAYLTAGPVTFQQISPQMIGQIQLQSKPNQTSMSIPLKLISPAQTVGLTASRTMILQQEKDES